MYNGVLSGLSLDGTHFFLREPAPTPDATASRPPPATGSVLDLQYPMCLLPAEPDAHPPHRGRST